LIFVGALLAGFAFACPISLIVVGQYIETGISQIVQPEAAISQVFSIAVTNQQCVGCGRIGQIDCGNLVAVGAPELEDLWGVFVGRRTRQKNFAVGQQ